MELVCYAEDNCSSKMLKTSNSDDISTETWQRLVASRSKKIVVYRRIHFQALAIAQKSWLNDFVGVNGLLEKFHLRYNMNSQKFSVEKVAVFK